MDTRIQLVRDFSGPCIARNLRFHVQHGDAEELVPPWIVIGVWVLSQFLL